MRRTHRILLSLFTLAFISPAHAEKGPVWEMKLPIHQRELIKPYALYAIKNAGRVYQNKKFYTNFLERALKDNDGKLDVLNLHPERRQPNTDFSLPFYNTGNTMDDIALHDFGFCLGFSYTVRKFNILAFYRPDLPRLARPEDYFPLIDAIADRRPAEIPGYANLFTLASDPTIMHYIKMHIADQWAQLNVSRGGLHVYEDGFTAATPAQMQALKPELLRRLAFGVNPIIYINGDPDAVINIDRQVEARVCELKPEVCDQVKKQIEAQIRPKTILQKLVMKTGMIHVLQVFDVVDTGPDSYRIRAWDINAEASIAATDFNVDMKTGKIDTKKVIAIGQLGTLTVDAPSKSISVHPSEDAQVGEMLYRMQEYCSTHVCVSTAPSQPSQTPAQP